MGHPSQRLRHLLAYRHREVGPRAPRYAARRYLFVHQGGRALDLDVVAGASSVCRKLRACRLGWADRSFSRIDRRNLRALGLRSQPPHPIHFAIVVAFAALMISAGHILARPLCACMAGDARLDPRAGYPASERGQAPSFWLLPLIALWANLHGGFVFGLVLVGAFALDAVWNADPPQRAPLAAALGPVRSRRIAGVRRNALRLAISPCLAQDSRPWGAAASASTNGCRRISAP